MWSTALQNNCYMAVANMAGRDLVYSYFGHSSVVDFDGSVLSECGTSPDELTYATLSLTAIRDARRHWTAENHLYNLLHRGYTAEPRGHPTCCFDFYKWVTCILQGNHQQLLYQRLQARIHHRAL
eukprot:GHRR01034113.1.p1 GENE.GHRR01034113.1~~GHRR01034113.1.p1  ORF type:complete len:125 (+),score=29.36 GHRR01034113.1:65-439(+)